MRQSYARTRFALVAMVFAFANVFGPSTDAQTASDPASLVFVCEHGSVKSLIAASLFNEAAKTRDLPFRAIARGVTPDASVPTPIADALKREGFEVQRFKPTAVSEADVAHASHVVAIGVDLSAVAGYATASRERWDDVPAASIDYTAAHTALKQHVETLLNQLQSRAP